MPIILSFPENHLTSEDVERGIDWLVTAQATATPGQDFDHVISNRCAVTLAAWHVSPRGLPQMLALAQGREVDLRQLSEELERDGTWEPRYYSVMRDWIDHQIDTYEEG